MRVRGIVWRVAVGVVLAGVAIFAVVIVAQVRGWREPVVPSGPATVRLMSEQQYLTTVHDLFGQDIEVEAGFPPLQRRQGLLALGASDAVVTPGALDQFDRPARLVAMQVVDEAHRTALVPCTPASATGADATCAQQFFARVGRLLYRRPLTESELQMQVGLAGTFAQKLGDFYTGLGYSLESMLVSPKFLYIIEATEPDPEHPGQLRLNAYAKATRLSLFLWNSLPDEALIEAAQRGELDKQSGVKRQIDRLLSSPRLEQGTRAFFSDLLAFDDFDTLSKDSVIYPEFTRNVAASAKEQALRLITDQLLTRNGDYRDLFTTSRTFVDETLAPLYNEPVPNPQDWVSFDSGPNRAAGLLTSLSFLALHAHPGQSSPTRRGRAIRELLLCQKVPDPPPNVNFTLFQDPNSHFKTARERLQAHATDPVCAGCHKLTDPMGLALENFDGAGAFRSTENGAQIDTRGVLDGQSFTDVVSLGQAMHSHAALGSCLASRLYAYGIGREVTRADRPWLVYIAKRFAVHDYRVPDLLREIASSRAFYAVSAPSQGRDERALSASTVTAASIQ
jgi:Protein of unknown function (DUF1592)/Protein of unknown function (DUF1588)/Protein of unknown function (DUF1595)/Protein of unknown function (DUF1585)/Protein of unknown function (DUF1587)